MFFTFKSTSNLQGQDFWSFEYDKSSNSFIVFYDECNDPCVMSTEGYCDYIDCREKCFEDFRNGNIQGIQNFANCILNCGDPILNNPVRIVERIDIDIRTSWAEIPFNPWDFVQNYQSVTYGSLVIPGNNIIIPPLTGLDFPWPNIYCTDNTCFEATLTVSYTDGSECVFLREICNIIG